MTDKEIRESEVEAYFVKRVKDYGFKQRKICFIGRNGGQDRLLIASCGPRINPIVWLVELKRPRVKPRVRQEREMADLAAVGMARRVVSTFTEVDALLETLRQQSSYSRHLFYAYLEKSYGLPTGTAFQKTDKTIG